MPASRLPAALEKLPGWEIISVGLGDLAAGRLTPSACAIWIAWPRLSRHGLVDRALSIHRPPEPEIALYRLLGQDGGDAYSRYGAILRRLVRFEHALDRATFRSDTSAVD